jgi:hypothetical protein
MSVRTAKRICLDGLRAIGSPAGRLLRLRALQFESLWGYGDVTFSSSISLGAGYRE